MPNGKRPQVRYHGLRNQGATCYLNSVLQVLFMTKDYRDAVKSSENGDTKFIDHHLSTLFDDLQKGTSDTYKITRKLGIDRVYEQRDAAEYYEKILNLTSDDASQIFHGKLTHKTICSSCDDEADSDAAFWHLPLTLVDPHSESYSVENGIEEYFKDADFSGENQMYCDLCDDKYDATIKCLVKNHPEVLMLLLKRFEFNFTYMTYIKNNCTVKVPYTLEIPQNQMYKLYAVVEHFGDLRSGHYTATIKSQDDGRWYTFDDTTVTLSDYQPFQVDQSETSNSAYLLFYRKIKEHTDDTCNPNISEMSSPKDLQSVTSDNSDQVEEESEEAEQASNAASVPINGNVEQAEMNEEQRRVEDVKTEKVETAGDDEESEKKEKPQTNHPDRDTEYQDKAALSDIRLNTKENLGGSQKVKQHHDLQSVSVNKRGDRKRSKEEDEIRLTKVDEMEGPTKRKLYKIYLCQGTVGDDKQNTSKDGNISSYEREGQQRGDKGGDKKVEEQIRGDDIDTQRKGQSESQHDYDQDGDPRSNVESRDNSITSNSQESNEEKTDSSYNLQDDHPETILIDKDMRRQVEADDEENKRENLSKENPLEERVEDQENDSERQKTPDTKAAVSDEHVILGHPNKQDEMNEEQRRVEGVNTEKVETTRDDEESEEKEKSRTDYPNRDAENQDKAALSDNGLNINENLGGSQEVKQHHDLQSKDENRGSYEREGEQRGDKGDDKEVKEQIRGDDDAGAEITMNDTEMRGKTEADDEAKNRENLEIKDSVHTGGKEPQPDTHSNEESHNNKTSSQENNEEKTDSSYNLQDAHPETILNDKDMRGKVETDDEEKKRENLSKENPLEERVEDQENDSERQKTPDIKLAVSDGHEILGHPNEQDEMNEEQRRVEDVNTEMVEKTGDGEESEEKEKSRTDYPDRDTEYQDKAALSDNGLNRNENLGGSQEVKQHHDLQSVSVNKQGDWEMIEEADEIREIRGDDIDPQRKGDSESQREYDQDGDQSNRSLGDTAQNKPEGKLSSTHTGHEGVSVVRQTKEQQNEKDKDAQSEADSSHRQEGSAGSTGVAENQGAGSVERRREDSQPKGTDTFSKERVGEISGSKKSKSPRGKSDPKNDPEVSLTESFSKLSLSDSDLPEQQKNLLEKSARKENREPDTQPEDSKRKVKTQGCFCFCSRTRGKKSRKTSKQE